MSDITLSKDAFYSTWHFLWELREDVPDTMTCALEEVRDELKHNPPSDGEYAEFGEWVNEICEEDGFPKLFTLRR